MTPPTEYRPRRLAPLSTPWMMGLGLAVLVLAAVLRARSHQLFESELGTIHFFVMPLQRVPLLDLLTLPFSEHPHAFAGLLSLLAVLATGALARAALPDQGQLAAMLLAALCPALVLSGSFWFPQALVVPLSAATCLLLVRSLQEDTATSRWRLGATATLLLCSDWPAWTPVITWLAWLIAFRPDWLERGPARRAARTLGQAALVSGIFYVALLAGGATPGRTMGADELPRGMAAVDALLDAISGLWLGRPRGLSLLARLATAAAVAAGIAVGWRRAARAGARAWASVLGMGSAGALIPAVIIHPLLPFAADKNLWYMSPMVLCLGLAAFWPITSFDTSPRAPAPRRHPGALAVSLLLLLAVSCTDEDQDGHWAQVDDCDDTNPLVHPEAPELWDGLDNDCDGIVDVSDDYVFTTELEPNDTSLGSCFAPEGQDLGHLAATGLLTRIEGRIDSVVDQSYEEGDRDCFSFRVPPEADHPSLLVELSWAEPSADLDLVLYGLWEGTQQGFGQSQAPGPSPERFLSSSGFDGGTPLWLWVVAYEGEPTDYQVDLVLR